MKLFIEKIMSNFIKAILLTLVLSCSLYSSNNENLPENCQTNCVSSYGIELGASPAGIKSYSNCNSSCVIFESNHYKGTYTGIKWQCVEYARRWLLHQHGVVYGDVEIAADIWQLDQLINPTTGEFHKFHSFVNGSNTKPSIGDLLIYGKEYLGTGHVAVIVHVDEKNGMLHLAEQNYANDKWNNSYARQVSFLSKNDQFWILDGHLIGWKRYIGK